MPTLAGSGLPKTLDILTLVCAKLNDAEVDATTGAPQTPAVWTEYALLPFLNSAYRQLQRELAASGIKFTYVDSDPIVLLPGDTSLTDLPNGTETDHLLTVDNDGITPLIPDQATVSALPVDYLWLVKIWEQPAVGFGEEKWRELNPCFGGLPNRKPDQHLEFYEQLADGLQFLGVTQNTVVKLRYQRAAPALTADEESRVRIRDSQDALAALTVAMAARSRGVRALVADMLTEYESGRQTIIANYFRAQQSTPARRHPYGARRKVSYQ